MLFVHPRENVQA